VQDLQADAALRLNMIHSAWGKLLYKFERWLLTKATRVSTITEAMRRHIAAKGIPAENVWLFPNWSDLSLVRPLPRDNSFRRRLGFRDDQTVFMYAGNMGEKQGLELIIRAAGHLRDQPEIQFVMVGNGAARERLELLARQSDLNNLCFLAVQPVEFLPELLSSADVHMIVQKPMVADFVMPSKLTNALASGIVVDPEDFQSLIDAILSLHNSPQLRDTLGKNARKCAEELLDKQKILASFEAQLMTFGAAGG
jgi:colanic acid biosynthesis glycosyl transferase WcaI